MAYIFGFIAADGCLIEYKNGYHGIDITSKDIELLKGIKDEMSSEHKIGKKERGYRLQIRNKTIYSDLLNLGLTPRKSKSITFPKVPRKFLHDFIRGCFDGDGSVFMWRDPRWRHSLQIRTTFSSGSYPFLNDLKKQLCRFAGLQKGAVYKNPRIYELHYGIQDSLWLYRFMYSSNNGVLYLKRKKEKFELFNKLKNQ